MLSEGCSYVATESTGVYGTRTDERKGLRTALLRAAPLQLRSTSAYLPNGEQE